MFDFAQRINGPDIRKVETCKHLNDLPEQHGLVVLAIENNSSSEIFRQFQLVASVLKSHYWFYHSKETCKGFTNGVYLLKRHLYKSIKFSNSDSTNGTELKKSIIDWIVRESYPVYGPVTSSNFEQRLSTRKILAIAILDEYKPAKKLFKASNLFYRSYEKFVKTNAQREEQILYAWSTDLDLFQSITFRHIPVPNLIILKPDYTYHLVIGSMSYDDKEKNIIPEQLRDSNVEKVIAAVKSGDLDYDGGNSFIHQILRPIMSQIARYKSMFRANPLLATVLVGLPLTIILVVFFTTCREGSQQVTEDRSGNGNKAFENNGQVYYDENDDEYSDSSSDDEQELLNNYRQD